MRRLVAMAAIAALLSACSHQPEIAQAPVAVPCTPPPVLVRPHLPIADLKEDTPPGEVMKAFVASIEVLKGYAGSLEKLLNGYRPTTNKDK